MVDLVKKLFLTTVTIFILALVFVGAIMSAILNGG